ncbi:MAG: prepilin peptidase [Terriglobales bacterium]
MAMLVAGLFGLVAGSFLSLCVYRLPRSLSVVYPGSSCPRCGHRLAGWENIPVVSYLGLRGRCRGCREAIGWWYPALELATAALFAWSWWHSGGGVEFVREAFFLACLAALAATDLDCRQLPDELTLGGWAVGLALAHWTALGLRQALMASVAGAGLLAAVGLGYQRWRGRQGVGWGDVKMLGLLGAYLGVAGGLVALVLAAIAGAAAGLAQAGGVLIGRRRRGRSWRRAREASRVYLGHAALPFGVFLAAAAAVALAWGPLLWRAWAR